MKTQHLALLSALVPFAALLSGCGGGNGATPPTATPIPAPTFISPSPGGVPNSPTIITPQTTLKLPSGQIGVLNLTQTGTVAKGTLRVFKGSASDSSLAAGLYPVVGAFAAPVTFNVQNQSTGANRFSLGGNLPQGSNNGDFTFSIGKINGKGLLLSSTGGLIPRSTPYLPVGDLQFSNFTSTNTNAVAPLPITSTGPTAFQNNSGFTSGGFIHSITGNDIISTFNIQGTRLSLANPTQRVTFNASLFPPTDASQATNPDLLSVGQSFDLTGGVTSGVTPRVFANYRGQTYTNRSGTMTIQSVGSDSITLKFDNVLLSTDPTNANSFVVNGTFSTTGLVTLINVK